MGDTLESHTDAVTESPYTWMKKMKLIGDLRSSIDCIAKTNEVQNEVILNAQNAAKVKNYKCKLVTRMTEAFVRCCLSEQLYTSPGSDYVAALANVYLKNNFFTKIVKLIFSDGNADIFKLSKQLNITMSNPSSPQKLADIGKLSAVLMWTYDGKPWCVVAQDGDLKLSYGFAYAKCEEAKFIDQPVMFKILMFEKGDQVARLALNIDYSGGYCRSQQYYFRVANESKSTAEAWNSSRGYQRLSCGIAMLEFEI